MSLHSEDSVASMDEETQEPVATQMDVVVPNSSKKGRKSKSTTTTTDSRVLPDTLIDFHDQRTANGVDARQQYLETLNYTTGTKLVGLAGRWERNKKCADRRYRSLRIAKSFVPAYGYLLNQMLSDGLTKAQMMQQMDVLSKSRWFPKLHQIKRNGKTVHSLKFHCLGKKARVSASKLPKTIKEKHIISGFGNASRISKPMVRRNAASVHSKRGGPVFFNPLKTSFAEEKKKANAEKKKGKNNKGKGKGKQQQ